MTEQNGLHQQEEHPVAAGVIVSFLRTGRVLDHASSVLLLGLFVLMFHATSLPARLAIAAFIFAIAEKYFAWRVALDAELFAVLGAHPQETGRFDAALAAFLGKAVPSETRSMASRRQGAKGLLLRQAWMLVVQLLATLLILLV